MARIVTCIETRGAAGDLRRASGGGASINLMQLFQQQYRIIGSFGSPISALSRALDRIAGRVMPVVDPSTASKISAPGGSGWRRGTCSEKSWSYFDPSMKRWPLCMGRHHAARVGRHRRRHRAGAVRPDATAWPGTSPALCAAARPDTGSGLPVHRIGLTNIRAAFPEKDNAWHQATLKQEWDNLGRVAGEYVHLNALWYFDPAHPKQGRI